MQPAPRDIEGFMDRHAGVFVRGVGLVGFSGLLHVGVLGRRMQAGVVSHDDVLSRHGKVDTHVVVIADRMMLLCGLDQHMATDDRTAVLREFSDAGWISDSSASERSRPRNVIVGVKVMSSLPCQVAGQK